jgi:alkaline phosphatase D
MPPLAAAFSATSITSTGDGSEVTGVTPEMPARNPHIRFFNNRRGYCRHERVAAFFRVP